MTFWIPAKELVPMLMILECSASLLFIRNVFNDINWHTVGFVVAGASISIPLALQVLMRLPAEITHIIIAALLMIACITLITHKRFIVSAGKFTWIATGITMGIFGGLGSIGGMAGMVILLSTSHDATRTRATMIALLLFTSLYGLSFSFINGLMTSVVLNRLSIVFIPMLVGLYIGHLCFKQYGKSLRTATLLLLSILSATMMMQSVWHLLQ